MAMDNFFNYITKNLDPEEVDIWFRVNNIIPEKMELYYDFSFSLFFLIKSTYLGNSENSNETKVEMTEGDNLKHFEWCWNKTLENFNKENIRFKIKGEHKEYYHKFFMDLFYYAEKKEIADNIDKFFKELFNEQKSYTKSDLDMVTDIYKRLDKNLNK